MDEEALIMAVIRLRTESAEPLNAAALTALLTAEGVEAEASAVKKAASKATKRMAQSAAAAPAPITPAAEPAAPSNKELKAAMAAVESLRAAEAVMMKAQKRLANRHLLRSSAATEGDLDKAAIERAVVQAISGALPAGETTVSRERFEADLATLQWILHPGVARSERFEVALTGEQRAAATAQLAMLNSKR